MRRELVLLAEMIEAAERAQALAEGIDVHELAADLQRRDALLWNFTVLGEAAAQLDAEVKQRFPSVEWSRPTQLRNRIVHGYWSIDLAVLHTAAVEQLPGFADQLRAVLDALESAAPA